MARNAKAFMCVTNTEFAVYLNNDGWKMLEDLVSEGMSEVDEAKSGDTKLCGMTCVRRPEQEDALIIGLK